jgi:glycosyltransferase involved in cell wall biosynthesis/Flp pilus assembly protein TadD
MGNRSLSTTQPDTSNNTSVTAETLTTRINQHLAANENESAYECLVQLLVERPDELECHKTAGLVAVSLGKQAEAKGHYRAALGLAPEDFDAKYNLILLEVQSGNVDEAIALLEALSDSHPDKADLKNDLAVLLLNRGEVEPAFACFEAALTIDPNFSLARQNALEYAAENGLVDEGKHLLNQNSDAAGLSDESREDLSRWLDCLSQPHDTEAASLESGVAGMKIAFFASHQAFLTDIMASLKHYNEVRLFEGTNPQEMQSLLEWADIAWFEWCDQYLIEATKLPQSCRIICRLHSYEAFTDMPSQVDWSAVEVVLFVSEAVRELFLQQVTKPPATRVIHNGVDLDRFTIPADKKYGKRIASVGYINYKKNPALLLYCFSKIHQFDPEYTFHVAGTHQDPRIHLYFENYLSRHPLPISFDGWVEDIPAWMADKDYVISTSLFESFHYSIAEGMASGLMPLIHDWYGADRIYPNEYLFSDPDQCLELLKRLQSGDRTATAQANRRFVKERYSVVDQISKTNALLKELAEPTRGLKPEGF